MEDALRSLESLSAVPFDHDFEPLPGVRVRFLRAGHLLGAAMVSIHAEGRTLLFSGDLGRPHDLILPEPAAVDHADYLVLESTYGDRLHDPSDPRDRLADVLNRTANEQSWPKLIIAASGMASGGRVLHHLRALAPDARNTILFTGFQADGTRGRALLEGATSIKMFGEYVPVRAEVAVIDNLSAHADYAETLDWLRRFARGPRRAYITHGEPAASDALRLRIVEALEWDGAVPEYRETVDLR